MIHQIHHADKSMSSPPSRLLVVRATKVYLLEKQPQFLAFPENEHLWSDHLFPKAPFLLQNYGGTPVKKNSTAESGKVGKRFTFPYMRFIRH